MTYRLDGVVDAGAYLTDPMFDGIFDGKRVRIPDLERVLSRAWYYGVDKIIIIGTSLNTSRAAYRIARHDYRLCSTSGVTPKYIKKMHKGKDTYAEKIGDLAERNYKVVALGECGLDFRLPELTEKKKKRQIKYFDCQVQLAREINKPLFMCCYDAFDDFIRVLDKYPPTRLRGVVHSFTGTTEQAHEIIRKGFYIGLNACSIKTKENLQMAKSIPLNRLVLGSGAPYCLFDRPHAGLKYIKTRLVNTRKPSDMNFFLPGRTEPAHVLQVLEAVAGVKKLAPQELCDIVRANARELFFTKAECSSLF